jgi:hypothetical protein
MTRQTLFSKKRFVLSLLKLVDSKIMLSSLLKPVEFCTYYSLVVRRNNEIRHL